MNYFHDMVDNIHQKRIWRPWNQCGSLCLHLRRQIWNSCTSGSSRHRDTRELPLEQRPNHHDTGCPVPDVSIYYMSNINELPDGILFHWFCKCTPPWMFLPLDIPSEYRPEHVTFGLLCVIFKFPSRIFCRRVPGFATDCPCGVWCRGLTTCLLYVGPPLEF